MRIVTDLFNFPSFIEFPLVDMILYKLIVGDVALSKRAPAIFGPGFIWHPVAVLMLGGGVFRHEPVGGYRISAIVKRKYESVRGEIDALEIDVSVQGGPELGEDGPSIFVEVDDERRNDGDDQKQENDRPYPDEDFSPPGTLLAPPFAPGCEQPLDALYGKMVFQVHDIHDSCRGQTARNEHRPAHSPPPSRIWFLSSYIILHFIQDKR